jgi:thiol-disulfide isomerase/thioredoxin
MVLAEELYQDLEQSNIRAFEKYKSTIESYIVAPYLKEPLFDLYNQTLKRLDNPMIASESVLHKLSGTSIKSEIDKIIANNKEKVIYIDCWATWCGPCISEFPNSKKLLTEYKNKNIVFIFICLNSEEINWKSVISKYSLAGQHYFLSKNQSSDFRDVFGIKGIPHYILFDKKGNISENGTASPSFIKDKLDKLLAEK